MKKLLVVLGPTATGKTDLALKLAKQLNGELIACDSRQVYVGLDIGTGKAPSGVFNFQFSIFKRLGYWIVDGIKIWMYDVCGWGEQYNVAQYIKDADRVIRDIRERGKLPIIVCGTGLYLKALIYGLSNISVPMDQKLRKELARLSLENLQKRIKKDLLEKWETLNESDKANKRRLIRSIEINHMYPYMGHRGMIGGLDNEFNILKIGLYTPRKILNQRIDKRVVSRINQGMVEEAENLHKNGLSFKRMRELGLEYGILSDYLEHRLTKIQLIETLKTKIHQYAKRQMTWFKNEREVLWFDISAKNFGQKMEKIVSNWYNS